MGDILVNIAKDVDFNKVVTKDIFKTVFADVVNPDQLAEAEADAEAFDEHGLAQTDTFAIVTPDTAFAYSESTAAIDLDRTDGSVWDGGTDQVGNVPVFLDAPVLAPEDIPDDLTIVFNGPGDGTIPPDLDDVTGLGDFVPLFPPPSGFDTPLPVAGELEIDDLQLTRTEEAPIILEGVIEAQYEITGGDWVVNYGERTIDFATNGGGESKVVNGELTLTVPDGSLFLVEFLDEEIPGAAIAEVEFEAFVNGPAVFEIGEESAEATFAFVADTDSVGGIGVADWAFNSIIIPPTES